MTPRRRICTTTTTCYDSDYCCDCPYDYSTTTATTPAPPTTHDNTTTTKMSATTIVVRHVIRLLVGVRMPVMILSTVAAYMLKLLLALVNFDSSMHARTHHPTRIGTRICTAESTTTRSRICACLRGQTKLGQVGLDQARPGQARLTQARSGLARP